MGPIYDTKAGSELSWFQKRPISLDLIRATGATPGDAILDAGGSGLSVRRHDAASTGAVPGGKFAPVESRRDDYVMPAGAFSDSNSVFSGFSLFRRGA